MRKPAGQLTETENRLALDALWRADDREFVGPIEPPMVKWCRTREPWPWEIEMAARRTSPPPAAPQQMEFAF